MFHRWSVRQLCCTGMNFIVSEGRVDVISYGCVWYIVVFLIWKPSWFKVDVRCVYKLSRQSGFFGAPPWLMDWSQQVHSGMKNLGAGIAVSEQSEEPQIAFCGLGPKKPAFPNTNELSESSCSVFVFELATLLGQHPNWALWKRKNSRNKKVLFQKVWDLDHKKGLYSLSVHSQKKKKKTQEATWFDRVSEWILDLGIQLVQFELSPHVSSFVLQPEMSTLSGCVLTEILCTGI